MAISTSLPISLTTVLTEIGLSLTSSLVAADTASNAGGFNATYGAKGDKNLQSFRGYTHVCVPSLTAFTIYPTNTSSGAVCAGVGGSATYYHNGGANPAINGDTVYTDAGGCTLMPSSGSSWVRFDNGVTHYRCQINGSGVITNRTTC